MYEELPQLRELLDLVTQNRDAACQEILDAAHRQAGEIVWNAEEAARKREREAVAREQGNRAWELEAARAAQETGLRQQRLNRTRDLLVRGRELLTASLLARWWDPAGRMLWLGFVVERANRFLPVGGWEVVHPEGWEVAELKPFLARLQATEADEVRFRLDAEIRAGLRIGCQGAWVDGTIAGITARGEEIDAMLLAMLEEEEESP